MDAELLLCLFISLLFLLPFPSTNTEESLFVRQSSQDNLVFQDYFLWSIDLTSTIGCARACAQDANCTSFTRTKVTSQSVTCRGHWQDVTSAGISASLTRLYKFAESVTLAPPAVGPYFLGSYWLTMACTNNSECSPHGSNIECFSSKCLCTPGYYFSTSQDACIISCSSLEKSQVMYEGWYISQHNIASDTNTWTQCRDWCYATAGCVSFEYRYSIDKCFISADTPLDQPSSWIPATTNLSYWQRTCV